MIYIPTQTKLYADDAAAILSEISMYPSILEEQLLQLHPSNEDQTINILRYLQKHNRVNRTRAGSYFPAGRTFIIENQSVIRCLWVLLDFMPDVEYHSASSFPVVIDFFMNAEEYHIIYAAEGNEALICSVVGQNKDMIAKRIILVDNPEQIPHLVLPGVVGYCTATATGSIKYFKLRNKEQ